MRPFLTVAVLATLPATFALAQDQTLVGGAATHGGFGGPVIKLTRFANKDGILMGGRGGMIVNGTYVFGGGGAGWSSEHVRGSDGGTYQLDVAYGGVDFEYIAHTRRLVHYAVQLTLGGGSASQGAPGEGSSRDDSFWIAEPGVYGEVNVTNGFRLGAGVSYRVVSGLDLPAFSDADLRGAAATITFKWGKFN